MLSGAWRARECIGVDVPKLSIIIPTFNRADYLVEAIESALRQRSNDFELIVSDNCSSDDTSVVVERYLSDPRFKYFRNSENIGMVGNWRRAVFEYSSGEWFIILSDDDYFIDDDYVGDVLKVVSGNDLAIVYAGGFLHDVEFDRKINLKFPFSGRLDGGRVFASRGVVKPQDFILCNVAFRRDIAQKNNAFDNNLNYCCDTELFLKSCLCGDVYLIDRAVAVYRCHSDNLIRKVSDNPELSLGDFLSYLKPYVLAKSCLDSNRLDEFIVNCSLQARLERLLLLFAGFLPNRYDGVVCELMGFAPELVGPTTCSLWFRLKFFLVRLLGLRLFKVLGFSWWLLKIRRLVKITVYFIFDAIGK